MSAVGYRWFLLRHWWACLPNRLMRWAVLHMPKRMALMAFCYVYGIRGDCGPEFDYITKAFEARYL